MQQFFTVEFAELTMRMAASPLALPVTLTFSR